MKTLTIIILIMVVAFAASAQRIEGYDPDSACRSGAEGENRPELYTDCMKVEQNSYNYIKANWSKIPTAVREYCRQEIRESHFLLPGLYYLFGACIANCMEDHKQSVFPIDGVWIAKCPRVPKDIPAAPFHY